MSPRGGACAGGSGGEPLISDAVGWGIVGALVVVGVYFVYQTRQGVPPDKERPKDKAENAAHVKTIAPSIASPCDELIVAQW